MKTDGGARKEEESKGPVHGFPRMYDCGKGIVYSFAGTSDGKTAFDAAQTRILSSCSDGVGNVNQIGGAMTTAFASSVLACGTGSILQGVEHIRKKISANNERWLEEKELFHKAQQNGTRSMSEHFPEIDQIPIFASSHFCRIDQKPLFL